jgi:hypothetical protein
MGGVVYFPQNDKPVMNLDPGSQTDPVMNLDLNMYQYSVKNLELVVN